jgi:hypothetical protein
MLQGGKKAPEIARKLKRTIGAIYARREYLDKKAEEAVHLREALLKAPSDVLNARREVRRASEKSDRDRY